jgi:hypothetical protein
MELGSRKAFVLVLAVGIAGTGLAVGLLNELGYGTVASVVWLAGYGGTVLVLWHGYLRPLDLSGGTDPDAVAEATGESSEGDAE